MGVGPQTGTHKVAIQSQIVAKTSPSSILSSLNPGVSTSWTIRRPTLNGLDNWTFLVHDARVLPTRILPSLLTVLIN